ncbi:MAG: aminoglycoside phosphotransferase family protein [Oceanospirillaceae bacterium]
MFENIKHPLVTAGEWQEIALGSSNQVFKAVIDKQSLILRINANCEFAFGVDRVREAQVLALIGKQSWAPVIVEYNLEEDWCLMLDHGSNLQVNEQSKQQMLAWLAQLQLFSQKVEKDTAQSVWFDYSQLLVSYRQQLQPIVNNQLALSLCHLIEQRLQHFAKVPACLMHQDLHPQNVCYTTNAMADELVVIDWEYSGWGMPWLDVAALHSNFEVDAQALQTLPVFKHLSHHDFLKSLKLALAINEAFSCVWYWVRYTFDRQKGQQKEVHQKVSVPVELQEQAQLCIVQLTDLSG